MKKTQKTFDFLTEDDVNKDLQRRLVNDTKKYFIKYLYKELIDELKRANLLNDVKQGTILNSSQNPLLKAYQDKKIYYFNGYLKGSFTIQTTLEIKKLGGVWSKKMYGYKVMLVQLPKDLQTLIIQGELATRNIKGTLTTTFIGVIATKIINAFLKNDYSNYFKKTIQEADGRIEKQVGIKKDLEENEDFVKYYTEDMNIYIKKFVKEDTEKLRKSVIKIIDKGGSHLDVREAINHNYNLNKNRARTIADGETRLCLTAFQETKFKQDGLDEFYWIHADPNGETSRPVHVHYFEESKKGKKFSYKNLPIDPETGKEDAPGRLYGCRCKARIIKNT